MTEEISLVTATRIYCKNCKIERIQAISIDGITLEDFKFFKYKQICNECKNHDFLEFLPISKGQNLADTMNEILRENWKQRQKDNPVIVKPKLDISNEEWKSQLEAKYQKLYGIVKERMPVLWYSLEFELSIFRILNIKGYSLPFAGIILGAPSSSKTLALEMLRNRPNTIYSDNFSAKSFVSHSANVKKEQLGEVKRLLTPELSPTFTKKDDDLKEILGIMTRILDGRGFSSDSGVHGKREYVGEYMFARFSQV